MFNGFRWRFYMVQEFQIKVWQPTRFEVQRFHMKAPPQLFKAPNEVMHRGSRQRLRITLPFLCSALFDRGAPILQRFSYLRRLQVIAIVRGFHIGLWSSFLVPVLVKGVQQRALVKDSSKDCRFTVSIEGFKKLKGTTFLSFWGASQTKIATVLWKGGLKVLWQVPRWTSHFNLYMDYFGKVNPKKAPLVFTHGHILTHCFQERRCLGRSCWRGSVIRNRSIRVLFCLIGCLRAEGRHSLL